MEIESKVTYSRHRIAEAYLWSLGAYFEPQYSEARIISSIALILFTALDDMYDAYATMEELELFTDAMKKYYISKNINYVSSILFFMAMTNYTMNGSNTGGFPRPLTGYLRA